MASNPPFQLEDQTDEDFFDKLVNDSDDDYKVTPNLAEDNDSDEARAFANLNISDIRTGFEDSATVAKGDTIEEDIQGSSVNEEFKDESTEIVLETTGNSIGPSSSFSFDGGNEPNNEIIGSDPTESRDNGPGGSGIKEVQWSAFTADPKQNGSSGFGSYSDFFTEFGNSNNDLSGKGGNLIDESNFVSGSAVGTSAYVESANEYANQVQEGGQVYATAPEQTVEGQDVNSSQYWENLYPGWKFDANTGQWYQVDESCNAAENVQGYQADESYHTNVQGYPVEDGYHATANVQEGYHSGAATDWALSNEKPEVSYLLQTAQSVAGSVSEKGMTESVTSWNPDSQANYTDNSSLEWNQASQENGGYPSHMVFDLQYPGWYYDTIALEWRSLDAYNSQIQQQDQLNLNGFSSTDTAYEYGQKLYGGHNQLEKHGSEALGSQGQDFNWNESVTNIQQQDLNMWQPNTVAESMSTDFRGTQQTQNHYGTNFSVDNHVSQQTSYAYGGATSSFEKFSQGSELSSVSGPRPFVPGNFSQPFSQTRIDHNEMMNASNSYYGDHNTLTYSQQTISNGQQFSYTSAAGRSSASRPAHALVTFGFGGKLLVMKDSASITNTSYGSHDPKGGSISVLNLADVVTGRANALTGEHGTCDYFRTLCRQSFPGPLSGGNVGSKELNKWIDERIAHTESADMNYRKIEVLKLLLSLLKIASQHYGKLRSPFGTDTTLKENDSPEVAVARLFASAKRNCAQVSEYDNLAECLQQLPSEGQMRATAAEVQLLLVSGRKKEALSCAQQGQLWGPALVLAAQLGDHFYVDTIKQMAVRQLVAGSPLRTLCLLIAGQPADVFSADTLTDGGVPGVHMSQQLPQTQPGSNFMLDGWEENLAVITANRTKDDELVLIHLGDCLWKERSDIFAAHICYLVAEASFEPYSDSARMCLIGADHWKNPRTYASPEAIQRTEVYEYSKLLGNSQFTLLPFQPYKVVYAHMLAEVGRVSDSMKYCQAVSKSLKNSRAPEVETFRLLVSSLEDRIKTHQQGGFSTNLAPGKLVGKLLNLFDSTAHRVVGGLPPPIPSTAGSSVQSDRHQQSMAPRVSTSQSTMAMSSLVPSASMEPIDERTADGNRRIMHNRSVSEPDFGRTPRQVDSSKDPASADSQSKAAGVTSRFGRFGFGSQLLQKTVDLVLKHRQDKQAKLGETNKFYYDEKLKRWVEEGAEPPTEESALPPPPTMTTFQNGTSDYNLKSALKSEGHLSNGSPEFTSPTSQGHSSGIPPIPTTSNQFSARGRTGVRARYVDTFNQGGGYPTTLFQSPAAPSIKHASTGANPKFFVPSPVPSAEKPVINTIMENNLHQPPAINENLSLSGMNIDSFQTPNQPTPSMQRFGSMDDISSRGPSTNTQNSLTPRSRRTASWSGGSFDKVISPPSETQLKPLGEVLGMHPSSFMPSQPAGLTHSPVNGASFADDLHEVEL